MKLFITGISGLIGRALTQHFLKKGWEVAGLTRDIRKAQKRLPEEVTLVESLDGSNDFLPQVVINLAGEPIADGRWTTKRKQAIRSSRIDLTRALVDWINGLPEKPECLISGSAVGYYGRHGNERLTEEATPSDEFTHELCSQWEKEALRASPDLRVCILRTGLVISKEGGFLSKLRLPFSLGLGGKLGDGKQYMSWVHRNDVVSAIDYLMCHETLNGAFNLTAPHPVTNENFTRQLADVLHRPAFCHIPGFLLRLGLGEMSDLLLTGQRVIPYRLQNAGYQFEFENLSEALREVFDSNE